MADDLKKEQANQHQLNNRSTTVHSGNSSGSTAAASQEITYAHNDYPFVHAEHGVLIDQQTTQHATEEKEYAAHHELWWSRTRHLLKDPFAEFMGTFIMIVFGDGSVAQVLLSSNPKLPAGSQGKGDYQSISWGWGIGVMFGVYVAGTAGGHLNPAVTFVNCLFRKFPWWKFPIYAAAQTLGCFCGAAVIFGNYKSAIQAYEGGPGILTVPGFSETATAGVFCTYPQPFMTRTGMFFSEVVASTILIFCIFALKDDGNIGAGNLTPLCLFFLIFGIGATLGWETGYAINLARDFGPRLFTCEDPQSTYPIIFAITYCIRSLSRLTKCDTDWVGYGSDVWRAGGKFSDPKT